MSADPEPEASSLPPLLASVLEPPLLPHPAAAIATIKKRPSRTPNSRFRRINLLRLVITGIPKHRLDMTLARFAIIVSRSYFNRSSTILPQTRRGGQPVEERNE